ncbi:MAG: adenylosuccinate lyase [Bacteroidetes bacterium HGW-Bacteroidetes-1]|jgi:adenylosuccinate lyase|nr:MAG: adenylosuccinate lyase [Bacteroidetes bacterium HGW-Bacteroidetes-1]
MELSALTAISPIDGRYRSKVSQLDAFFSEFALMRYRVMVEMEYFIALCEIPLPQLNHFDSDHFDALRYIYQNFTPEDAYQIKEIEKVTNHDVKAVEYFLKKRFDAINLESFKEFIHFGLTSQDINNVALPLALKGAHHQIIEPAYRQLCDHITQLALQWKDIPMLARTHGQPASPTRLGKEIQVFAERINDQLHLLSTIPFSSKFGGATGNFNAHKIAYPAIDWVAFANNLVMNKLDLHRQQTTTQIEHYDYLAAYFDGIKRLNTILLDLCRDLWMYIMLDYFKQKIKEGEIGSSAMPHKVNPIDFENAEGNLGIANAIFEHFSNKLPVSRLQRDLTDSTVTRNIGVPLAHSLLSIFSIGKGLDKLLLNEDKLKADLQANWAVVAEGIQTILRREQIDGGYELLKQLTRTNQGINATSISNFIDELDVSETIKSELRLITPESYTGIDLLND